MKKEAESAGGIVNFIKKYEDWFNLVFGILTLIILIAGGGWLVKEKVFKSDKPQIQSVKTQTQNQEAGQSQSQDQPAYYVVQAGDSLWKIAQEKYNDGYKWVLIAKANKIAQPDLIYKGQKLIIPQSKTADSDQSLDQSQVQDQLVTEYTVKKGDVLWHLTQKFYQDPFLYLKVANYNNIPNPNVIEVGQVIKFPPKDQL